MNYWETPLQKVQPPAFRRAVTVVLLPLALFLLLIAGVVEALCAAWKFLSLCWTGEP